MTIKDITDRQNLLETLLSQNAFHDAFSLMLGISESIMFWEITDKIKEAQDTYRLMISYALKGVDDNTRDTYLETLKEELMRLFNAMVIRKKLLDNKYEVFINTLRTITSSGDNLSAALTNYADNAAPLLKNNDYQSVDDLVKRIFNLVWTANSLTKSELGIIEELASAPHTHDSPIITILIGALLLRSLSTGYDSNIMESLLNIYEHANAKANSVKALCVFAILAFYFNRQLPVKKLTASLERVSNATQGMVKNDLRYVTLEYLRTIETERIHRKMVREIFPTMFKVGSEIKEKFRNLDEEELLNLHENPEWLEMLEESGLADTIQEMNELQNRGADVMFSTFGNMKNFPFFQDVPNWFLPFNPRNAAVADILDRNPALKMVTDKAMLLCDSDMYSMAFSLGYLSDDQKKMMQQNLANQLSVLDEMTAEADRDSSKMLAGTYIKNLFRFFKLYRRSGEFNNPFKQIVNPVNSKVLAPYLLSNGFLSAMAEFFMKQEEWDNAFAVCSYLEQGGHITSQLYQKMGFCLQKKGDLQGALNYYLHAEVLEPDSLWVKRRIAYCSRHLEKWSTALEYYEDLSAKEPEDAKLAMALGKCYMKTSGFDKAVKAFYKADYLQPDSQSVIRALVRALIMNKESEQARKYAEKLDLSDPESYLLQGHLAFINKRYEEALTHYLATAKEAGIDYAKLRAHIETDREMLEADPANRAVYPLILEELAYIVPVPKK